VIAIRIGLLQPRRYCLDLSTGLLDGSAGLQLSHDRQVSLAAILIAPSERVPDADQSQNRGEPVRNDANNGGAAAVESQTPADDCGIGAEFLLPESLAKHRNRAGVWREILRREQPAEDRADSKNLKEAFPGCNVWYADWFASAGQRAS